MRINIIGFCSRCPNERGIQRFFCAQEQDPTVMPAFLVGEFPTSPLTLDLRRKKSVFGGLWWLSWLVIRRAQLDYRH